MNRKYLTIFFSFFVFIVVINGLDTETYFMTYYDLLAVPEDSNITESNISIFFPIVMVNNNTIHEVYNRGPVQPVAGGRIVLTESGNYLLMPNFKGNIFQGTYFIGVVNEATDNIYFESHDPSTNQIYFKILAENKTKWNMEVELELAGYNRLNLYGLTLLEKIPYGWHPYSRYYIVSIPPDKIGQWVGLNVPQEISLTERHSITYKSN